VITIEPKKIISVVGARPNFMKIAPIHRAITKLGEGFRHIIVHTGQHYDYNMSDAFFRDLELPPPDVFLGVGSASHAVQTATIMIEFEKVLLNFNPDIVLVAGDVNSTIAAALTAKKMGIPVGHIEGGLRSFDRDMPEEINRIATDAICDYCFVTEESAINNLHNEGFADEKLFFVGNTMIDSLVHALPKIEQNGAYIKYGLDRKGYVLVTMHRPSNVDDKDKLTEIIEIFEYLSQSRKIVFPVHPRTLKSLQTFGIFDRFSSIPGLLPTEPISYIDFISLMSTCDFIITDSGGIQEESTWLGIPCITARTTTERPVTIDIGTNYLVNPDKLSIINQIDRLINEPRKPGQKPTLWDGKAGERIADIIKSLI
jgi:UDP-N-acetylglucosamine 2-epimerase (non-hydrolysing)